MKHKIKLKVSQDDEDVAYLKLPAHPGENITNAVKKTIRICDIIPNYKGADLYLDFDEKDEVIGIEILV